MALEDLTGGGKYIANLVNSNPLSADDRREGDDHIRGIKNVLLNTFPGLSKAINFDNLVLKSGDTMTGPLTVQGQVICGLPPAAGGKQLIVGTEMAMWQSAADRQMLFTATTGFIFAPATGMLTYVAGSATNFESHYGSKQFVNYGPASKPGGGAWADSSDARIKEDIDDYTSGLAAVLALRPRTYRFRRETERDTDIVYTGLIAQECIEAMPELVSIAPGTVGAIVLEDLHTLDTSALPYALVNAIKTLHARINELERLLVGADDA